MVITFLFSGAMSNRGVPVPGNPAKYDIVQVATPSPIRKKREADIMLGVTPEPSRVWMQKRLRVGANPSPKPACTPPRTFVMSICYMHIVL